MNLKLRTILCAAVLAILAITAAAQTETGQITGTVTDPSSAVVVSAQVTARDTATGFTRTTQSTDLGYILTTLPPGTYAVTVEAKGFRTFIQKNVAVTTAESQGLNFKLEVGALSEQVTVTSAPDVLDTASGSAGAVLTSTEIQNAPLNGRQIYMLLGTTPGSQFLQTQFGASGYSGTRGWPRQK